MSTREMRYLEEKRKKQAFLTAEIIEKGYDPDAFTEYCELMKSSDIDMWTLQDLTDCVEAFKLRNHPVERPREVQSRGESPEPLALPAGVRLSTNLSAVQLPPPVVPEPAIEPSTEGEKPSAPELQEPERVSYPSLSVAESAMEEVKILPQDGRPGLYTIPGKLMPSNPLAEAKSLRVCVENPELVSGGFFSKSYISYEVITFPFNWHVKRRFTDFEWLRSSLNNAFPGYFIPPVPPRQPTNQLNEDFVMKRIRFLRKFMDALISTPAFSRSQILFTFLKDQSMDDLKSFVAKLKKPDKAEDVLTVTPMLVCDPDLSPEYCSRLDRFLAENEAAKKKLKRMAETVTASFTSLSDNLRLYAEELQHLADLQHGVPEGNAHSAIYGCVSQAIVKWASVEQGMGEAIKEYLNSFFKYRYNEMNAFKELLANRERHLSNFQKAEAKLVAKKDKLWQQGDVSKWDLPSELTFQVPDLMNSKMKAVPLMLPRETQEVEKMKNIYAYFNNQVHTEFERVMKYNSKVESTHFGEMASNLDQKLIVFSQEWRELLSRLTSIQD